MKKVISYIAAAAISISATAQTANQAAAQAANQAAAQTAEMSLQARLEAFAADPSLSHALTGICVRTADGRTLVDIDAEKMLMPASNMKLISTGAALHQLGSDYQYETSLGCDGEIVDGVLRGNLYIIGGGDPTTGSKDSIAVAIEKTFGQWEAIIRASGIKAIEGDVIGDGRCFDGMTEEPTWLWNDIGTYYGAGATGLMFYENMQSFAVSAGPCEGAPVNISPSYPDTPWMTFLYDCTTGKAGTGDRLYMYTSDMAPIAEIRGTFGVDRAAKRLDCSNKFPEYTCAYHFRKHLVNSGIPCEGGVSDFRLIPVAGASHQGGSVPLQPSGHASHQPSGSAPLPPPDASSLTLLGSTFSPTLSRIVFETNHDSNNLYAETLLRTLGKEVCGSACYDSSYVALDIVLKSIGIDTRKGAQIQDGSGLSRQNYISPDFICRFLDAMMDSPQYGEFLRSLPSPGGNGTLSYNMKGQPASIRNRIKVKSGSMNGVRCYSGYILPSGCAAELIGYDADIIYDNLPYDVKANTLVFSIMTNNCTSPTWKVRPLLDRMMAAIASAN